jgi:hypothetical protein
MLEFAAGLAVGTATMLAIAVTLGARWRRKRRRVDALHEEMLTATWAVQDAATILVDGTRNDASDWQAKRQARNTAARRYFAAVGE